MRPFARVKLTELERLAGELERLEPKIRRELDTTEAAIHALDPTRLRKEAIAADSRKLRRELEGRVAPTWGEVQVVAMALEQQRPHYSPEAIRARAKWDADPAKNATVGLFVLRRLELATLPELEAHALTAAADGDLATGEAIRGELRRRDNVPTEQRTAILSLLQEVPLPAADLAAADLIERTTHRIAELGVEVSEQTTGKARTLDRLTVAYQGATTETTAHATAAVADGGDEPPSPGDRLRAAFEVQ